ncbi:MAG TPA: metallophosphatase domain-containing protein [Haliscomenobacter sp.]|uniref:metallophosphatase domain-containing protein n=1 Tax=Haliscomenobacter sp. TaxID=2717303 RepID=UPI002CC22BC9|nr:metallophosphatase domain-containing protein [Haliscomenobacter sp.]HOY16148.1 metallophosphatase domain-containing protein [Haliscomenobacter sp.]HPH18192.1 metallophosphatase domain-containing protein [Haliscomenobacter sp.]
MRFVAISDTHGKHNFELPEGDVLLHAGDVSSRGLKTEIQRFLDWFAGLDYTYKIFIAGNHDFFFEEASADDIQAMIPPELIYLNDSGVEIAGIHIWGSPIQPWFYDWAFNRQRGPAIQKHWDLIPANSDIVITHGPVFGIHDRTVSGLPVGCEGLLPVIQRIKPKVHLCGHIHEAYGSRQVGETLYLNASILDVRYTIANPPIVFDVDAIT